MYQAEGMAITTGTSTLAGIVLGDTGADDQGGVIYNNSGDYLYFRTGGAERLRILNGGGLTFNGDTAGANALDDYEEGSFTPSMTGLTGTTVAAAQYTKVGRLVSVDLRLRWTGSDNTTALLKFGLPFTSASPGDAARTGIVFYSGTAVHSGATISCHLGNGGNELTFYRSDGGGFSAVLRSHVNGTYDWLVSFSYFTG